MPTNCQVLNKFARLEDCQHRASLLHAWASGNLTRQAAYGQQPAVSSALYLATGLSPSVFLCPCWCKLHGVRAGEVRLTQDDDTAVLVSRSSSPSRIVGTVLPQRGLAYKFHSVTHVIDRGSIGSSCTSHKAVNKLMEIAVWDSCHGQLCSIKSVAQHVKLLWRSTACVVPVLHMNNGPFHSCSW